MNLNPQELLSSAVAEISERKTSSTVIHCLNTHQTKKLLKLLLYFQICALCYSSVALFHTLVGTDESTNVIYRCRAYMLSQLHPLRGECWMLDRLGAKAD